MDDIQSHASDWYSSDAVEYHEPTDTYRTEFHPATRSPSEAVVATVAAATDVDELALPPLFAAVDADDLDALFVGTGAPTGFSGEVSFDYADCRVTVRSHGTVEVVPPGESEG